jgi:hypothetical protein
MNKYYALISAAVLMGAVFTISPMMVFAQAGTNATDLASRLAPGGGASGIVEPTERVFVFVCPQDFQSADDCQIFLANPAS